MAAPRPKVLIVGGGVLAQDLSRSLGSAGAYGSVTVAQDNIEDESGRGLRQLDLASPRTSGETTELLTELSPDIIVYLALSPGPGGTAAGWDEDARAAEAFTSGLRRWLERGGRFKAMVALSSTVVYGVARVTPLVFAENFDSDPDEPDPESPMALWGEAVREMESLLRQVCKRGKVNLCVLRAAPLVSSPIPSYMDKFINSTLPIRVAGFDPPMQTINYSDLLDALLAALETRPNVTLNIAGPDVTPLSRLVALSGRYAVPMPLWAARRFTDASIGSARLQWRCVADVRRAKQVLAISPRHGVERDERG